MIVDIALIALAVGAPASFPIPKEMSVPDMSSRTPSSYHSAIHEMVPSSPSYLGSSQLLLLALSPGDDTAGASGDSLPSPISFSSTVDSFVQSQKKRIKQDVVIRVLDANTIKLEKTGLISFAAIQTPTPSYSANSGAAPPECMSYTPASKAKQLLPPKTKVGVVVLDGDQQKNVGVPRALIVTFHEGRASGSSSTSKLVNTELVRAGMAKPSPRGRVAAEALLPGLTQEVEVLQDRAKTTKVGMYQTCDAQRAMQKEFSDDDQFEPLDRTVETQYSSEGGKPVVREKSSSSTVAPKILAIPEAAPILKHMRMLFNGMIGINRGTEMWPNWTGTEMVYPVPAYRIH
jgi:endonuclease YncB( thermonuclease family)